MPTEQAQFLLNHHPKAQHLDRSYAVESTIAIYGGFVGSISIPCGEICE
ncbi:MAG: hypothetical protein JKY67_05525 [Pseudomonadales bacterium]|nr:hypothetical protein [Pseudomonadales bacterium]